MKKLALLQLLLLPLAGLADVVNASEPGSDRGQCEHVVREMARESTETHASEMDARGLPQAPSAVQAER